MKDQDPMSQKNMTSGDSSSKKSSSFFKGKATSKTSIDSKTNIDEVEKENEEDESKNDITTLKRGKSKPFIIEEAKIDETVTNFKKALVSGLLNPGILHKPKPKKETKPKEPKPKVKKLK
jgi:hypothetical protein